MAHRRTGNGTPSIWTKMTPGTSGSETEPADRFRNNDMVSESSVPALVSHATTVPAMAQTQAAMKTVQNWSIVMPGTIQSAKPSTMALPKRATRKTAIQPAQADTATMTGLMKKPITALTAAAAT